METYLQGLLLQSSLILALGAQNLFVLDCGIRKRKPVTVALVCAICDFVLIVLGVLGAATLFQTAPFFRKGAAAAGVIFLLYYGIGKIREGVRSKDMAVSNERSHADERALLLAALSFSLLNPHVYLDTVVLIGGYSSKFATVTDRLFFGAGAASFSLFWFLALSLGASAISSRLSSPRVMRWISFASGGVLIGLGIKLGCEFL